MFSLCFVVLALFFSCDSKPVSLDNIDVYPGAMELKAGESRMGDTLAENVKTHRDLTKNMGPLAAPSRLGQRGFRLPAEAKWEEVRKFYEENLEKSGWELGLGGIAGQFVDVNRVMATGNDENSLTRTVIFSRGNQKLTIIMTASPVNRKDKTLVFSLTSN